jgi:hypothetical protein
MTVNKEHQCQACGYDLGFKPWNGDSPSDEICPSCGIQFGYSDFAGGRIDARAERYRSWRLAWIAKGMPWSDVGNSPPEGWDPQQQLKSL